MSFMALESIFEVGFECFGVFRLGLAENEEVAGDGLAGNEEVAGDGLAENGGSRLGQPSPVSAVAREVREKKKKKKKTKTRGRSVREE
jgi:hypothetical protein